MTAEPGDDVVLPCQGTRDTAIVMIYWIKPDMEAGDFMFIHDQRYDDYQHPSFHGRVKLRDPSMTCGDASVILKNFTTADAGTYECHVGKRTSGSRMRSPVYLISILTLNAIHIGESTGSVVFT